MQIYEGREPYIFISYAHKDSAAVLPLIEGLQTRGFRVWYDAGIEAGSEWPEYIADRLGDSACVVAFITAAALASQNCRREINFSIHLQKEMLVVYLEEVELSRGMMMQLGVLQALFRTRFDSDVAFLDALCESKLLGACNETAAQETAAAPRALPSDDELYAEAKQLLDNKDYTAALPLLRQLAESGHAEAQNSLGVCYYNGQGIAQDYTQAVYWFRKAAESGQNNAQFNLGVCYSEGQGVAQDDTQVVYWFRKAAEAGNADAQYHLAELYVAGRGVEEDYYEAARWFHKAAESGHTDAAWCLGTLYGHGLGVPSDYEAAARWFRKAAEVGNAEGQYLLGMMYQNGYGVPRDIEQAVFWFRKAAAQKNGSALEALIKLGY